MSNAYPECILDDALAEEIINRSVPVLLKDGFLFRQGEPADNVYIVASGEVMLSLSAGENEAVKIQAAKGWLPGLPAVIGNQPYAVTAKAAPDAEVFKLGSIAFKELLDTEPRLQKAMLQILAAQARIAVMAMVDLASDFTRNNPG